MDRQLKFFFEFLENEKKLSENTLQSYKRDLKQFKRYIEACEVHYNRVKEEDIKDYIRELQENGKKPSSISRCISAASSGVPGRCPVRRAGAGRSGAPSGSSQSPPDPCPAAPSWPPARHNHECADRRS